MKVLDETLEAVAEEVAGRQKRSSFDRMVPIIRPNLPEWEPVVKRLESIFRSKMLTNHETVRELEARVAKYIGVKNVVALSSCTSGLILAMKAMGITGEVITPSFTFSATGHAVYWAGATPVFVDCSHRDWNISLTSVLEALSPETQAILAVHIFGNPAPVRALEQLASDNGIRLIFDSAHGFGSAVEGKRVGGFGDVEVFSLSPTKLVTGGEGGLLTTDDDELAEEIRYLRNYGNRGDYDCQTAGINARMAEFNAAMILEGIPLVDEEIDVRQHLSIIYKDILSEIPGIQLQEIPSGNRTSWKDFTMAVDPTWFGTDRDELHDLLLERNIQTKKYFYPPLHQQSAYKALPHRMTGLSTTDWISANVLTLPLYSHLGEEGVMRIALAVKEIHEQAISDSTGDLRNGG